MKQRWESAQSGVGLTETVRVVCLRLFGGSFSRPGVEACLVWPSFAWWEARLVNSLLYGQPVWSTFQVVGVFVLQWVAIW